PRHAALPILAAVMNLVGGVLVKLSGGVATTVGKGIIEFNQNGSFGLLVVFSSLAGAIVWNVGTWYLGLPSSSSHALIGGLVGAALAAGSKSQLLWRGVVDVYAYHALLSPLVRFNAAHALMVAILWIIRKR